MMDDTKSLYLMCARQYVWLDVYYRQRGNKVITHMSQFYHSCLCYVLDLCVLIKVPTTGRPWCNRYNMHDAACIPLVTINACAKG